MHVSDVTRKRAEKGIHDAFLISIIAKGLFAVLQIVIGGILLFTNSITEIVVDLINNELLEDPTDFFASKVQSLLHPTPEAQLFGGLYLVSHGIVKIFLVVGLLRNKLWAYPASMGVFSLFIIYQLFRYFYRTHSVWLLVLTVIDIVVIWLIYHEYREILRLGQTQTNLDENKSS